MKPTYKRSFSFVAICSSKNRIFTGLTTATNNVHTPYTHNAMRFTRIEKFLYLPFLYLMTMKDFEEDEFGCLDDGIWVIVSDFVCFFTLMVFTLQNIVHYMPI